MGMQAQDNKREKLFVESEELFEKLISELRSADTIKMSHNELEELLQARGQALMRQLMQDHLDMRFVREQRQVVKGSDRVVRSQVKDTDRGLMTIFGPVRVSRLGYAACGRTSLYPADAELKLPKEYYSYGVRERVAEEVTKSSFDEVVTAIEKTTGARLGKRQAEELALRAAQDFELFYSGRSQSQQPMATGSILVMSTDGKGIVVRKSDLRTATRKSADKQNHKMQKRLSRGEKRNRKRMAQVASVYTIEPYIRSAEDIVAEFRPICEVNIKRPRPEQKRVWASIEHSAEEVITSAFSEALSRDPNQDKTWAILIDGNPIQLDIIEHKVEKLGIKACIILDIIHVLGYLWKAAFAFYEEGSKAAEDWVSERLMRILQGKSATVAAGMRRSATLLEFSDKERERVDKCADYLLKYGPYLRYQEYLAAGLPIATGVIEGACRHLIQDRMDITGARWSLKGAEAVLRLRSLRSSKDFDQYWRFHLNQEFKRNYSASFSL